MIIKKYLFLIFFAIFVQTSFGQSDKEIAKAKSLEAEKFEAEDKTRF